ncbi:MAG TPA: rhodanese-like domain-containing protein [Chitinophagaceae bacterium]|nr:rhodanese-like domain-containing protein [Chitinophagaceae bacterium]
MFIKQLYTNCLSEAAYYIESEGEAAIIDPIRDTAPYLDLAAKRKASIKYIFETHFHADFVSGHLELSKQTGAPIVYGPETETNYPIEIAKDGQQFKIGKLTLQVLHTPGHTLESTCYLLLDENKEPHCVFTGDTLFVGDVGRPDLSSGDLSSEELAALLFRSLQTKIKTLPDHVIVYPAHGPGSSCGKNIGKETQSTIGQEKQNNYALLAEDKDEFIKAVTSGLTPPPSYFSLNAKINKEGYDSLEAILKKALQPVAVKTLKKWKEEGKDLVIVDTRHADVFAEGYVPESVFIGLEGRYAEWAGMLLPYDKDILLITETGKEEESVVRLARVGFENMIGFLKGGFEAWKDAGEEIDLLINVEPDELIMDLPFDENLVVLDVRKETEFEAGHVDDAENLPLEKLKDPGTMAMIEETDNIYVHCAGGYRSTIACSLLKRQGIHNIRNVIGGWKAISELMQNSKN